MLCPNTGCVHWLASPSALCLLEACSSAWACKTNDDEPVSNRSCVMASWRICAYLVLLLLLRLHRGGRLCSRRGEAGRVSGAPIAVVVRFQRPLGLRTTAANASDGRCKSKNPKRAQDTPAPPTDRWRQWPPRQWPPHAGSGRHPPPRRLRLLLLLRLRLRLLLLLLLLLRLRLSCSPWPRCRPGCLAPKRSTLPRCALTRRTSSLQRTQSMSESRSKQARCMSMCGRVTFAA